ncbi:hypothetical protein FSP39_022388 [Pinctada imbricata]|uniref:Secretory carrier-associated membrane protein n=1 Tax=Pinctada imbricata TaxID=66713 RepID=A0AA88Y574_PINIB|nr:hypothetical protein FSP39_022388 [Pinctada imbricata]
MLSYDTDGHMNTSLYDKRDDFNFSITNFPFLGSNIPSSPAYGVFISQLIRYARISTKYTDFVLRARRLSDKLLSQGYVCNRLTSSLRKFYGRYGELVIHYDVPLSRMDPSVQQAARGTQQNTTEEFNPFAEGNQTRPTAGKGGVPPPQPSSQPAIMQPSSDPPPYTESSAQRIDTADLQKRQEELERKAAELQRKEQEMKNMQFNDRQNNWPPLPKCCPVGPCFYQDFSVDIPLEFQRTVKFVYYLWMFYSVVLFLNVLASLAYFIVDGNGGTTFGLSIVWFVLFIPCSFICWYRPLYKAFRSDSSFNFFLFFFIIFFQIVACVIMAAGVPDFTMSDSSFNFFVFFFVFFFQFICCIIQCLGITGYTVGVVSGLSVMGKSIAAGLTMTFVGLFFGLTAIISFAVLVKVHKIYRSTGASFDKAKQEFSTGVMQNQAVQSAAANAAAGAAKGMAQQYGSNNKY